MSGAESHDVTTAITMGLGSGMGRGRHERSMPNHADMVDSVESRVRAGIVSDGMPCGERRERHSQPHVEGSACTRGVEMGAAFPECTRDMSMGQSAVGGVTASRQSHMQWEPGSEARSASQTSSSAVGRETEAKQTEGTWAMQAALGSRDEGVARRRRRGARRRAQQSQ